MILLLASPCQLSQLQDFAVFSDYCKQTHFLNSGVASLFKKKQNKVSIFVTKSATLWEIVSVVCLLTSVYTGNQCKTVTIQLKNVRLVPFFWFLQFFPRDLLI